MGLVSNHYSETDPEHQQSHTGAFPLPRTVLKKQDDISTATFLHFGFIRVII